MTTGYSYVDKVLDSLEGVQETSSGWVACCPVAGHGLDGQDEYPSLRVTIGDSGRVLLCCRVGCPEEEILKAMDLTYRDLFVPQGQLPMDCLAHQTSTEPEPVARTLRDQVYRALLARLTLEPEHQQALQG